MKTVTGIIFEARNGRRFLNEEDCIKHEEWLDKEDKRKEDNKMALAKIKELESESVFEKVHEDNCNSVSMTSINILSCAIHKKTKLGGCNILVMHPDCGLDAYCLGHYTLYKTDEIKKNKVYIMHDKIFETGDKNLFGIITIVKPKIKKP